MRPIDKETMLNLIIEAKRTDPETGSFAEWLAGYLVDHLPTIIQQNEPLTQADLDSMDYDKVWIDYEDGTGEWALVCDGVIYSIDTLEGAGLDFGEHMQGEMLEPHGYKVYRRPPEEESNGK